jgi:hypothetical protein
LLVSVEQQAAANFGQSRLAWQKDRQPDGVQADILGDA